MEGEERAELWHHPQPFLQHSGVITNRETADKRRGEEWRKEARRCTGGVRRRKRAEETTEGSERGETARLRSYPR